MRIALDTSPFRETLVIGKRCSVFVCSYKYVVCETKKCFDISILALIRHNG